MTDPHDCDPYDHDAQSSVGYVWVPATVYNWLKQQQSERAQLATVLVELVDSMEMRPDSPDSLRRVRRAKEEVIALIERLGLRP